MGIVEGVFLWFCMVVFIFFSLMVLSTFDSFLPSGWLCNLARRNKNTTSC